MSNAATPALSPISLWDGSAEEEDWAAPFAGGDPVDVAIVGGGYTGLASALFCAERGLAAHVLEAERIGHGGSGRNVGLVNAGIWLPPGEVRAKLGGGGDHFLKIFGNAPRMVFDLIERHQIRCEATRTGTIHAAHAPSGMKDLEKRWKEWQAMGEPVDLLSRDEVSGMIGSEAFYGGLVDHRAGTVNPMAYCRGLARAARGAGARISTGVRVTGLRKDGTGWIVETDKGALRAKAVVLGTNAYTDTLWPGLDRSFTPIHFFQLATKPLGERVASILPGRQGIWDTGLVMFSLRRDAFDRLIIGSMGHLVGTRKEGLSRRWAAKQLRRLFPDLGEVEFEEAWDGRIAMTPDHIPRIFRLDDNLYTPIGYNGRGITTGTVFGKAMADLLTGADSAELPLPVAEATTVRSAPLMSRFYQFAFTANQVMKSL